MNLHDPIWSLVFVFGGLAVAVSAAAGGFRLIALRRALDLQLALAGKSLPPAVVVFCGSGAFALHASAALYCLAILGDQAVVSASGEPGRWLWLPWTAVVALMLCGAAQATLAALDLRLGLQRKSYRAYQLVAGVGGLLLAALGAALLLKGAFSLSGWS